MALIELEDVTKEFRLGSETIKALDRTSLTIESGEFVSLMGASGCGKTTLMNILGLLDTPTSGIYRLDGRATETLSDNERASLRNQKIGFVFQTFNLLARASALRNVEMPLEYATPKEHRHLQPAERRNLALEALRKVSLLDRMNHKPSELSGGQRQRVAIARALVNRPQILFADEPTGNLDSKTGGDILALFDDLHRQGMTIMLVTHDQLVAKHARKIIRMMDGKIQGDLNAA